MVLSASLTLKWDCGLRQIQKEVRKLRILVRMGLFDQKFHADDENTFEL
jgi:hypothetical protein